VIEPTDTGDDLLDRLAGLQDDASRIAFLSDHPHTLSNSFAERLDEVVGVQVRVDLKKADSLADAALVLANHLDENESRAFALRAKANVLWFQGHNRQASELHVRAIRLFEEAGNSTQTGRTLSTSIQPLILLGEYERAHAAAARARKIFFAAQDTVRLARLDINIGNILHRQDRFREALDLYEHAFSQLLSDKDVEGMIAARHNVAACLIMLNDFDKAESAYEQVQQLCRERNLPLAMAQAEYNLAYLHYLRGAYSRAIEGLRTARATSEQAGDLYHAALCQLDLSEIYLELNIDQDALELAEEAFASFEQLDIGYEKAKALCNVAIALSQRGDGFRALKHFAQARDLFVKEKNLVWPSLIDLYQAVVYFNEGRLPEAQRCCLAALEFFSTWPLPGRAILCRLLLAKLLLKTGEVEAARQQSQCAFQDLAGTEVPILVYQTHFVMGQIEEALGEVQEARFHYQVARDALETLRIGVHGEELKLSFLKNKFEVYENLVDLCLAPGSSPSAYQEAWNHIEQAKSRSLLELVARRMNPVSSTNRHEENSMAFRIGRLREELDWYYHRIEVEQLGQEAASHQRLLELRGLAQEREGELLRALRDLAPEEAEAAGMQSAVPASLDSVREALGPKSALVEYFRVRDRILAAIVTLDGVEIITVTRVPRVAQLLRMLQFQFSKFQLGQDYLREFHDPLLEATRSHLNGLYEELFAPVRPKLNHEHLVVAPHELLHYVPFHALFDGERYLIDSYAASYVPSASIYLQCRRKSVNRTGPSLILGVPDRHTPSIYGELQAVAEVVPQAKVLLGSNASKSALMENGPHSRFIHIAAHGFFRRDNPMFSGLRLGDSFLTLYDLYDLKLPAELITLSGCSTGLSVIAAGDELIGLSRGLLSAGARRLLLTLWDVNDSSTAEFMKAFYGRVASHPDLVWAVRAAMIEIRKSHPHPYYWSPFVLVG
jgi:CHAT domain-containing protein